MNRFELWLFRCLLRKHINKSAWLGDQLGATSGIFQMVRAVWYETFCEDSAATISAGLSECFEATQVWPHGRPPLATTQPGG